MGREWIKIKQVGQLFLEKVLVTFDIPILFVCVDYENRKYLCLNIDDESGKSVIVATDNKHLLSMLRNEVSMESVFRNAIDEKVIVAEYDYETEEIISYTENSKMISRDMLPKENEYFELTNKMLEEYIIYLEKQLVRVQIESFSEKKSFIISKCRMSSNFVVRDMIAHTSGRIVLNETKKKCAYDIRENNRMIA